MFDDLFFCLQKAKEQPKQTKIKNAKLNLFGQNNKKQSNNWETHKAKKYALQKKEHQSKFGLEDLEENPLPKQKHCYLKKAMKKNILQQCWIYWPKYIFSVNFCVTFFA